MAVFDEVLLPELISQGSSFGPSFNVEVITTDGGSERRIERGGGFRMVGNLRYALTTRELGRQLYEFAIARGGAARGFNVKVPIDFNTTATGDATSTVARDDQQFGVGDGTTTQFQLTKTYGASDPTPFTRTIRKPVSGSVLVEVDGSASTAWSLDYTTGIITFDSAPADGHVLKWGGEFYTPMRFRLDPGEPLAVTLDNQNVRSVDGVEVIEIVDTSEFYQPVFSGGAIDKQSATGFALQLGEARFYRVNMTATLQTVTLPDPAGYAGGGPYFTVAAVTGSETFDIDDDDGNNLLSLSAGSLVDLYVAQGASSKAWFAA